MKNSVSDQHSARKAETTGRRAEALPDEKLESRATKKRKVLLRAGDLFHVVTRYPRKPKMPKVDRLAGILRQGLVAPACCEDGSVYSDLNIVVTGAPVPYDSLVFLHRFGPQSSLYTIIEPGRFMVFVDPSIPVLTPQDMGRNWAILCRDEVYVRDRVAPESLTGVAVHPADGDSVMNDLMADFRRVGIPLYDYYGNVLFFEKASQGGQRKRERG